MPWLRASARLNESAESHQHVDQVENTRMILNYAIGIRARAAAGYLLQFSTCAAATRCRAPHEMEWTQTYMRLMVRYRCVAYSSPQLDSPKGMILKASWCDLGFVATPPLQH
jgi:hypothetical protein